MNGRTSWMLRGLLLLSLVQGFSLQAESLLAMTDLLEDTSKAEMSPVQLTVNKLMKIWTLLDMIQALQRIPAEYLMLFARELVEGIVFVNGMIDKLLQYPEFGNDMDSLAYIYDLIEHINIVQTEAFEAVKLDEIACVRVMIHRMQKKLLLILTHQQ